MQRCKNNPFFIIAKEPDEIIAATPWVWLQ